MEDANALNIAFENGNFHHVAASNDTSNWRRYAALGLCGSIQPALNGLAKFDTPEARFYEAVTYWLDGDEDRAAHILEKCVGDHAATLLSFIRKRRITILSQLPWSQFGEGPHMILAGGRADPKFSMHNIGFEVGDLTNSANASIHRYYNPASPPDLYLAQMVEWQMIPPNLQELQCPIIGQTADYDLHIHAVHPWLQLFDHLIVTDTTEHHDVSRLSPAPTYTFPKSFCLPQTLPPQRSDRDINAKDLDILVTGTSFHPYHRDKGALIQKILELEETHSFLLHGFLNWTQYARMLSRSRLALSFIRHPGATPSRGLEALAMGVPLLTQQESTLRLWVGEDEGLQIYTPDTLKETIRSVLANYPKHHAAAGRGIDIIRKEFDVKRLASQYLRFAVFLASIPKTNRKISPPPTQKCAIAWQGWVQPEPSVYVSIRQNAFAAWQSLKPEEHTLETLNAPARETMLTCVRMGLRPTSQNLKDLLAITLDLYRAAVQARPESLALRFNFIRAALHFGTESDIEQGLSVASETLAAAPEALALDCHDDVMTWDYCNDFFNYRAYFDIVTEAIASAEDQTAALKTLVYASLHYYRARMTGALEDYAAAATMDPDFPSYRLWWAKALDAAGDRQSARTAIPLLETLAQTSLQSIDAWTLLQSLTAEHDLPAPNLPDAAIAVARMETRVLINSDYDAIRYGAYFQTQRLDLARNTGVKTLKRSTVPSPTISILIADLNGNRSRRLIATLEQQSLPRSAFEIIGVEIFERASPHLLAAADTVILCGQSDYLYNKNVAFNAALACARGEIVLFIDGDITLSSDALSDIIERFNTHEPSSLAVWNEGADTTTPETVYGLAVRRDQAIAYGGLDEGAYYAGRAGGPSDLAHRLANGAFEFVSIPSLAPSLPPAPLDTLDSGETRRRILQELWPFDLNTANKLPIHENPEIAILRASLSGDPNWSGDPT